MSVLSDRTCSKPECGEPTKRVCDFCDRPFCGDHGSKGGDIQVQDVGPVAYPSMCWACGGFDLDGGK